MRKVLFLIFHGFSKHNGISKKIWGQVRGFRECGADVKLCYYDIQDNGHRIWRADGCTIMDLGTGRCAKLKKRYNYAGLIRYVREQQFDLVYMRSYHNANPFTIRFVDKLKTNKIKIVMEIPTYPYDQEYITFSMRLELFIDKLFRRAFAKHLDGIVTFTDDKEIFGQNTIRISNGIDFDEIPLRHQRAVPLEREIIHLLAVAEIHYWHGFDRIIKGLIDYNKQYNYKQVVFHLVGALTGDRERDEILSPIMEYGLEEQVILHGPLWGSELDDLFDLADFAIGSLGRHRTGIAHIRTLKNREYAARGIPFIYSESDADFDHAPYVLKAPPDESPVAIRSIIDFLQNHVFTPQFIRSSVQKLSWTAQMQKVIYALYPKSINSSK